MAFFDTFTNPMNNPTNNLAAPVNPSSGGLFDGMNIFGTSIPTGIFDAAQEEKLRKQALTQGLLGSLATYIATPKNLGAGSALPYLGKAFLGGMSASRDVPDRAISNLKTQREFQQFALKQEAMKKIMDDPRVKNDPVLYGLAQAGEYDKVASALGPTNDIKNYERAKRDGFKGNFLQYQQTVDPFKAAMYEWTTGQPLPGLGGGKATTGTPIRGQGGMNQLITVTDPNGIAHQFPNQAAADAFKRRAGITN
jgi:hypothetical protein